ncbi:putative secreted protein (Por secretion system target) [Winogradskyella wandonensis]|uniref:Putative secreted protein (Por secretion system target) n=1 Tax=Winogradskyella wandonensis TaxID=1442586 RepID=A0A4R1KVX8_9FLAO|nr:T9SS type A sorting domain-containing protein [Winogradskyella wandonensis]TCK69304.1 putative secreted protein (Por secretion system target) [Winogradskyella wandonensis]
MRTIITFLIVTLCAVESTAQIINFDDQGYTNSQNLGNPYSITNNSETFRFTISGSTNSTTQHRYVTQENSCTSTGLGHVTAGTFPATTWTIETVSGNEIDLGTIRFDNVFGCFSFEYNLSIEGFKNNVSTGSQTFTTNGLNSIFSSNASFDDIDKIVITSSDLGNLGIDDISWALSSLHNQVFSFNEEVRLEIDASTKQLLVRYPNQIILENYSIFSMSGNKVASGNSAKMSTEALANGIYVIQLNFDKETVTKKVIIR